MPVEPNLEALTRWLRQGSWTAAAKGLAALAEGEAWTADVYVTDGEFLVTVSQADGRIRRRGVKRGQLVAHADGRLIASEEGCYAIRPLRKPGPVPRPPEEVRKGRTVYLTDAEWEACGLAGDAGASAYARDRVVEDLKDRGLL